MEKVKEKSEVVIIGGVAAGPKTAAVLSRRIKDASITLFEKGNQISYGSCGMPYFASGDINSFAELTQTSYGIPRDSEFFEKSKGFDVKINHEVIKIDRENKSVTVKKTDSGANVNVFSNGRGGSLWRVAYRANFHKAITEFRR